MSQPKRYDYTRWQLAQGSSMSSVHPDRGDEDERRCVWVAEDDYIRLKKDYDAATKATFDAIQTITQLRDDYAALVQQGIRDHGDWRSKLNFLEADYKAEIARLTAENEVLRKKVEWLQKADRLVIWTGTEWQVRHQLNGESRVVE